MRIWYLTRLWPQHIIRALLRAAPWLHRFHLVKGSPPPALVLAHREGRIRGFRGERNRAWPIEYPRVGFGF